MTFKAKVGDRAHPFMLWGLMGMWAGLTFSSALVEICFVISLIAWLWVRWSEGRLLSTPMTRSILIPFLVYLLISILSYFWSEDQALSYRGVFKIVQQALVFLMAFDVFQKKENMNLFFDIFLIVAFVLMANAFYQLIFGTDFIRGFVAESARAGLRVSGAFKSYGLLASYCILTIPFLASLGIGYWKFGRRSKLFYLCMITTAGNLWLLIFTRSRGAIVAFLISLVILLILNKKIIVLTVFLALTTVAFLMIPKSMVIHLDVEGKEQSLVERYHLWKRAINVIESKPWGGTGINTYDQIHEKYDQTHNWRVRGYYAHNGYLQLAAEVGVPGLIAFLWFLIAYGFVTLKSILTMAGSESSVLSMGLFTGLLSFLVLVLIDTVLHNMISVITFWFLMGITLAIPIAYKSSNGS